MDSFAEVEKVKNIPADVRNFLEANPNDWFTNEQLAEKLSSTPSGIRNAFTKLKSTGLIKTHNEGSLAFRAWHSAQADQDYFILEAKKSIRKCNGCGTTHSRYWRSDLEEKNGWLCNNCGMNQRRGRGIQRVYSSPQMSEDYPNDVAPAAEPDFYQVENDNEEEDDVYSPSHMPKPMAKRKFSNQLVDPKLRKCGHCQTTKSAGKWRRDREYPERYLCNKCGMNQRRAQMRLEQQQQQQQALITTPAGDGRYTRSGRQTKSLPCNLCEERIPSFVADCAHRICGECATGLIRHIPENINCPVCNDASIIPSILLGKFIDSLRD